MALRPQKLWQQMRVGAVKLTYSNPVYRYMLQGEVPETLAWLPAASGLGDAANGNTLLHAQFSFGGESCSGWPPPWQPAQASAAWRQAMHSFGWLEDLRTEGSDQARQACVAFIADWLAGQDRWQHASWSAPILGARLAAWISAAHFFLPAMDKTLQYQMMVSIARQLRSLAQLVPDGMTGLPALLAYKGMIYAGLNLPDQGQKVIGLALELLTRRLNEEILPDGGHVFRSPQLQLTYLQHLLAIRTALGTHHLSAPAELDWAIKQMVPALRSLRHGDGGFALFHGSQTQSAMVIDRVLDSSHIRSRGGKSLPHLGYERVQAGRCLLLCDVGLPPAKGQDAYAHAGLLSFEFSHGRERLITNCGGGMIWGSWRQALASTAAHSTVQVADTNAAEVIESGGLGRRPKQVTTRSYALDQVHTVTAMHDGYRDSFGLVHERSWSIASDGSWLRGQDILRGPGVYPYVIRFHLHPKVQCNLLQNNQAVLLRTASGQGWKFLADCGRVALEPSLYCGAGAPRRAWQITVTTRSGADVPLQWLLQRTEKLVG